MKTTEQTPKTSPKPRKKASKKTSKSIAPAQAIKLAYAEGFERGWDLCAAAMRSATVTP